MNTRAPIGKTKFRVKLDCNPPSHLDVIAVDETDAVEQVQKHLVSQGFQNVGIGKIRPLLGAKHRSCA